MQCFLFFLQGGESVEHMVDILDVKYNKFSNLQKQVHVSSSSAHMLIHMCLYTCVCVCIHVHVY